MPFIQRIIEPVYLSRPTQPSIATAAEDTAKVSATHDEFTSIANCTLSNVLRQLGSVVLIADEILTDLGDELQAIRHRTDAIRQRIVGVEKSLEDIESTIIYKPNENHFVDDESIYKTKRPISTSLFTASTRPKHIRCLYEKAAAAPVLVVDGNGENNNVNDWFLLCSPTLGHTRRKISKNIDAEIETRIPAAIEDLRKWTSSEAIGETTVSPNCLSKVGTSTVHNNSTLIDNSYASFSTSYVDGIDVTTINDVVDAPNDVPLDHKLPSPEEQCLMIAQKFPAEIVPVNTSNVRFERMCSIRKSLGHMPMGKTKYVAEDFQAVRRPTRSKKATGKRRNTIAGIDDKDIKEAFTQSAHVGKSTNNTESCQIIPRSKSNDLLRSNGTNDLRSSNRLNHFRALKQWGKHRLKLINKRPDSRIEEGVEDETAHNSAAQTHDLKPMKSKQKTQAEKTLKQNPLYSSSEKLFINLTQHERKCSPPTHPVKLRASITRRQRRNQPPRCEEPNSSSGNWSASSESGRTSASSEVAMHTKSSASCTSLNHNNKPPITACSASNVLTKRRFNTSTSSSITSDDTLVSSSVPHTDLYDDETSSMYSCDTEGYFTSFHVDSGLKTLKEEEITTVPAMMSTSALLPINGNTSISDSMSRTTLSVESDYELFGKGSTSTTASSAGTVCTALLGSLSNNSLIEVPLAPERKSSLNSKLHSLGNYGKPKTITTKNDSISMKNDDNEANISCTNSNLSTGDNYKSDPYANGMATISDLEISENSDFEGAERVKRIRGKTLINAKRIPSICVITPLNSDDEDRVAAMESMLSSLNINQKDLNLGEMNEEKTVAQVHHSPSIVPNETETTLASSILPLAAKICSEFPIDSGSHDEPDSNDDYVTIKDIGSYAYPSKPGDVISSNLDQVLSGNLHLKTEYVSLNELPCNSNYDENLFSTSKNTKLIAGANVKLNPNGMFVYDSNSLRYKRSLCTTFKGIPTMATNSDRNADGNVALQEKPMVVPKEQNAYSDTSMSSMSSLPFDEMASKSDSADLDDVYVTLAADKSGIKNIRTEPISVSDSELIESTRKSKSATWPLSAENKLMYAKKDEKKRRFSWEQLATRKTFKLKTLKLTYSKLNFPVRSTIKSKAKTTFKTSTPLKNATEKPSESSAVSSIASNFGNSTSIPQVSFNKRTDAQQTTCSDRLGVPKTSLNDFKKLLLTTTNKKILTKPSAVEQLKLRQDIAAAAAVAAAAAASSNVPDMKILDLSSSPKSFANRRVFQQSNSLSPYKKPNIMSPRSRWKYNNFSKNTISSIPEVNVEDDVIPTGPIPIATNTVVVNKPQISPIYATPHRKNISGECSSNTIDATRTGTINTPTVSCINALPVKGDPSPSESSIIETNLSLKDNIFLQTEENNFMKGEIRPYGSTFIVKSTQKAVATGLKSATCPLAVTDPRAVTSPKSASTNESNMETVLLESSF